MSQINLTVEELVEGVEEALQHWLDIHFNAEKWAEYWCCGESASYTFEQCGGILKNNYFEFDWGEATIKYWVKDNYKLFKQCPKCYHLDDSGEEYCEYCGRKMRPATRENVEDWMKEVYYDAESLANIVSDSDLLYVLETQGFKVYRQGVKDVVSGVASDIRVALRSLRSARSLTKLMTSLTWALHVCHVSGDVVEDYGYMFGLDYATVDRLQQDGLARYFSLDEFGEYLKERKGI